MSAGCSGGTLGYDLAQQAEEAERWLPSGHLRRLLGAAQDQARLKYPGTTGYPTRLGAYEQTTKQTAVTPNSQLTNDDYANYHHSCS